MPRRSLILPCSWRHRLRQPVAGEARNDLPAHKPISISSIATDLGRRQPIADGRAKTRFIARRSDICAQPVGDGAETVLAMNQNISKPPPLAGENTAATSPGM